MNADDPTIGFAEHDGAAQATLIAARFGGKDTLERLSFALASPDGADHPQLRNLADATMVALLNAGAYRMAWRLRAEFPGLVGPGGRLGVRRFGRRRAVDQRGSGTADRETQIEPDPESHTQKLLAAGMHPDLHIARLAVQGPRHDQRRQRR